MLIIATFLYHISTACASLWQLDATSNFPSDQSNFSVIFDDAGDPDAVAVTGVVSFSGVTATFPDPVGSIFYDVISEIPSITVDGLTLVATSSDINWRFEQSSGPNSLSGPYYGWDYNSSVVPIPGAVWLLGSGLIGIVGVRRKFSK